MSDPIFRRATRADLTAIVTMLADDPLGSTREAVGPTLSQSYVEAFDALSADPNQLLAVVTEDERVVGTLQLTFIPGLSYQGAWRGQIEAVRVAADRRSAGLGKKLFEWAIEQCRGRNCRLVQLTTNASRKDAQRFYDTLGFKASHLGYKLEL